MLSWVKTSTFCIKETTICGLFYGGGKGSLPELFIQNFLSKIQNPDNLILFERTKLF